MNIWDDKALLEKLENDRDKLRDDGKRMTFDCLKALVKGDRVVCSLGKRLGQASDGGITLTQVMRGICSGACKNCGDYTVEESMVDDN